MKVKMKSLFGVIAIVSAFALALTLNPVVAGFAATVQNTNNTVGSGTSFLTASKDGGRQCTSVPAGQQVPDVKDFVCAGSQLPAAVNASGVSSSTVNLNPTGTAASSSAMFSTNSCGVVQNANTINPANAMLPRNDVSFQQEGPFEGSRSMDFNGSDTMSINTASKTGLKSFTLAIWFKTTAAQGAMFGWTNSASAASVPSVYNNHLYMNSAGQVLFSTYSQTARTVTSPRAYNDGKWHVAVVVGTSNTGTSNAQSNLTLYVDNQRVVSTTFNVADVNETNAGFWRVGQTRSNTGYPGTGQYFDGLLSNFTVFNRPLTAAQVANLSVVPSQSVYDERLRALTAAEHWPLSDNGETVYAGTYPNGVTNPCTQVRATVGTSSRCILPASATTCAVPTNNATLQSLGALAATSIPLGTVQSGERLTTTLARADSFNAFSLGLQVTVPSAISSVGFPQVFTWSKNKTILR